MDALIQLHRDYFVFILDTVAVESHCVGYGIFFRWYMPTAFNGY